MNNDLILWLCGLAGVIFHTSAKGQSLLQDARVANKNFNFWRDYILYDWLSIFLSINSVWIWYLIFGEIAEKYTSVQQFARVSFVVMGVAGSWIIQYALSKTKRRVRNAIDEATGSGRKTDMK